MLAGILFAIFALRLEHKLIGKNTVMLNIELITYHSSLLQALSQWTGLKKWERKRKNKWVLRRKTKEQPRSLPGPTHFSFSCPVFYHLHWLRGWNKLWHNHTKLYYRICSKWEQLNIDLNCFSMGVLVTFYHFTGKYTTCKFYMKLHPGPEWHIFHIPTSEDIDDDISRFSRLFVFECLFVYAIIRRTLHVRLKILFLSTIVLATRT